VGAGKVITGAGGPDEPQLSERELTPASPSVPSPVVSQQERRRLNAPTGVARTKPAQVASQTRAPSPKPAAKSETTVSQQPLLADTEADAALTVGEGAPDTTAADTQLLASRDAADTANEDVPGADLAADSVAPAKAQVAGAREEDDLATRRAAAEALAELDRERRRERANAATAALPPPRAAEVQPAEESTPRPPSLEQRAQIYLRIGLDEAAKQLGRPVHVIEGMTPQFMGLARGQLMPGGNPRRPVVRVVYLDARGRMILLDQQRIDSGEGAGASSGSLRWTIGDVLLYLRGEPGADVLRGLQQRVR
jgi:hypothetical protein